MITYDFLLLMDYGRIIMFFFFSFLKAPNENRNKFLQPEALLSHGFLSYLSKLQPVKLYVFN